MSLLSIKNKMLKGNLKKQPSEARSDRWKWKNIAFIFENCCLYNVLWCASTERFKDCLLFFKLTFAQFSSVCHLTKFNYSSNLFPKWWWRAGKLFDPAEIECVTLWTNLITHKSLLKMKSERIVYCYTFSSLFYRWNETQLTGAQNNHPWTNQPLFWKFSICICGDCDLWLYYIYI